MLVLVVEELGSVPVPVVGITIVALLLPALMTIYPLNAKYTSGPSLHMSTISPYDANLNDLDP
jgi:hypothetical protein